MSEVIEGDSAMQQAAVVGFKENNHEVQPDSAELTAVKEELKKQPEKKTLLHKLNVAVALNLNLTDRRVFEGTSNFRALTFGDATYNFYNPFRKAKAEDNVAEGIVRSALYRILHQANEVNLSNTLLIGSETDVAKNLKGVLDTLIRGIQSTFPIEPEDQLVQLRVVEEGEEEHYTTILMRDVVRVTGWVTRQVENEMCNNTLIINITINSGALYDAETPAKLIAQAQTVLSKAVADFEATSILFGLIMDPAELGSKKMRELFEVLLEDEAFKFTLFTKKELYNTDMNYSNWVPASKAGVDRDLLTDGGELILIKSVI